MLTIVDVDDSQQYLLILIYGQSKQWHSHHWIPLFRQATSPTQLYEAGEKLTCSVGIRFRRRHDNKKAERYRVSERKLCVAQT